MLVTDRSVPAGVRENWTELVTYLIELFRQGHGWPR